MPLYTPYTGAPAPAEFWNGGFAGDWWGRPTYTAPEPIQSEVRPVVGGNASPLGRPIPTAYGMAAREGDPVIDPAFLGGYRPIYGTDGNAIKVLVNLVFCILDTQLGGTFSLVWARANKEFIVRTQAPIRTINSPYRFYGGDQTAVDPLITQYLAAEFRTAWPGFVYIVFQDFDILPYENRVPVFDFQIANTSNITTTPGAETQSTLALEAYHPDAYNFPMAVDRERGLHYQIVTKGHGEAWLTTVRIDTNQEIARVQITESGGFWGVDAALGLDGTDYMVVMVSRFASPHLFDLCLLRISSGVIVHRLASIPIDGGDPFEPEPKCAVRLGVGNKWAIGCNAFASPNTPGAYVTAVIADLDAATLTQTSLHMELTPGPGGDNPERSGISMVFGAVRDGVADLFYVDHTGASTFIVALAKLSHTGSVTTSTVYTYAHFVDRPGVMYDYTDGTIVVYLTWSGLFHAIIEKVAASGAVLYSTTTDIDDLNINVANETSAGYFYRARPGFAVGTSFQYFGNLYQIDLSNGSVSLILDFDSYTDYDVFKYYDMYTGTATEGSEVPGIINRIVLGDAVVGPVDLDDILLALCTFDGRHDAADIDFTGFPGSECYGVLYESDTSIADAIRTLREPFDISAVESDGKLKFRYPPRDDAFEADLVLTDTTKFVDQGQFTLEKVYGAEQEALRACEISFFDVDNYGERGTPASFARPNGAYDITKSIDRRSFNLPLYMTASRALEQAALIVYRSVYALETYQGSLGPELAYLEPGDIVTFPFRDFVVTAQIKTATLNANYSQNVSLVQYLQAHDATYTGAAISVPPITSTPFEWLMPVASGSYLITGTTAGVLLSSIVQISAETGSYVIAGSAATLTATAPSVTLTAAAGSYAVTGTAATLTVSSAGGSSTVDTTAVTADDNTMTADAS